MRTIENTRENDIHIQVGDVDVLVPAATMQPSENGEVKVNGQTLIEDETLKKAQGNAVIGFYFKEGHLVDVTPEEKAPAESSK